jgi:hypothetical protein
MPNVMASCALGSVSGANEEISNDLQSGQTEWEGRRTTDRAAAAAAAACRTSVDRDGEEIESLAVPLGCIWSDGRAEGFDQGFLQVRNSAGGVQNRAFGRNANTARENGLEMIIIIPLRGYKTSTTTTTS